MKKDNVKLSWTTCLTIGFLGFIAWVIYMANTGQSNAIFQLVKTTPYGDKIGHFSLFGLLTLVCNLGLKFKRLRSINILLGTLFVLCFSFIEEASQHWISTRTLDGFDLLADTLGILLFDFISRKYHQFRSKQHIKPNNSKAY